MTEDHPQLSTAYHFATPRFEQHITPERVERIAHISHQDGRLSAEQILRRKNDAEIEFERFYSSEFDESWTHRQIASAEFLDSLSELSARLEGLQSFAEMCDRHGVKSSRELLLGDSRDAAGGGGVVASE